MKADLYNLKNEKVGSLDLSDKIFGAKWRGELVKQMLEAQLANKRDPWAHAKGRGEVRGGGRKPWRQKGTGRARHGSSRSPLWIGGGKAHGPNKERDYSQKINKKMRRVAILAVLSKKFKDGEIRFFEKLETSEPKTKAVAGSLRQALDMKKNAKKYDLLLVPVSDSKNIVRAAKNLPKTKVLAADSLNVYDLLNFKNLFIDSRSLDVISKNLKV